MSLLTPKELSPLLNLNIFSVVGRLSQVFVFTQHLHSLLVGCAYSECIQLPGLLLSGKGHNQPFWSSPSVTPGRNHPTLSRDENCVIGGNADMFIENEEQRWEEAALQGTCRGEGQVGEGVTDQHSLRGVRQEV